MVVISVGWGVTMSGASEDPWTGRRPAACPSGLGARSRDTPAPRPRRGGSVRGAWRRWRRLPGDLERAGQRNESAIHYHFGSRAGLIVAILEPREDVRGPIEAERERWLDDLASRAESPTLRDAVEAFVLPAMAYLASHDGRSLIRVAAQVMRTLPLELRVDPNVPSDRRVTDLMGSLLPEALPESIRRERLGVARTLVTRTAGQPLTRDRARTGAAPRSRGLRARDGGHDRGRPVRRLSRARPVLSPPAAPAGPSSRHP